jgi:hypothetical protein
LLLEVCRKKKQERLHIMSKNAKSYQAPTHEEIAVCAQSIYEREGRPQGREVQHWLQAEAQLIAERKAASAPIHAAAPAKPSASPPPKHRGNDWQTTGRQTVTTN